MIHIKLFSFPVLFLLRLELSICSGVSWLYRIRAWFRRLTCCLPSPVLCRIGSCLRLGLGGRFLGSDNSFFGCNHCLFRGDYCPLSLYCCVYRFAAFIETRSDLLARNHASSILRSPSEISSRQTDPRIYSAGRSIETRDKRGDCQSTLHYFLDNADFFTAAHGDLITGTDTALTIDGLTKAEVAFLEKTDPEGKPLGVVPKFLLVPNNLSVPASQLMHSLEIRDNQGGAYPTANPHTGKFQIVRSSYLSAPSQVHGDPRTWYLVADPSDLAVIEVAFLHGQDVPTIEHAQADFNVLGIQMRGFHDFGVAKQDARGAVKMMGR